MTKKEWNKLRLQVALRKRPLFQTILYETGWCEDCKHYTNPEKYKKQECRHHKQRKCRAITIPTINQNGNEEYCDWYNYYYPLKFNKDD